MFLGMFPCACAPSPKLDMTLSLRPTGQQAGSIRSEKLTVRPLVLVMRPSSKGTPRSFEKLCALSYVD
jgi:hypothetical protein